MGGILFLMLCPPYVGVVITHHIIVATLDTIEYVRNG